jgi:hypothetical protein
MAAEQRQEVGRHLKKRRAALRWRYAAAAVLLPATSRSELLHRQGQQSDLAAHALCCLALS